MKMVILIDNNFQELCQIEAAIKEIDPDLTCLSFVYADEAIRTICYELRHTPQYILMDITMSRKPVVECLVELRNLDFLRACKIVMFSSFMPEAVAGNLRQLGATHAFQKPASNVNYKEIFSDIIN